MDKAKLQQIPIKFNQYLLMIIFCALLLILVIFQFNKLINKELSELDQKKQQKVALEERITNLTKLESEYQAISGDVDYINIILPKQEKLVDIIGRLEKKAEEDKVEFAIKFDGEPTAHKLPAKITLKGYYSNVMNYYKWLISGDILVHVSTVDLSDTNNMLDNAKGEFGLEVYFE